MKISSAEVAAPFNPVDKRDSDAMARPDLDQSRRQRCYRGNALCARLLSATAIERMAVVSSVTVVPNARIAGVAFTGVHGYKPVGAMGKPLELDGGKRVVRKQEGKAHTRAMNQIFIPLMPLCGAVYNGFLGSRNLASVLMNGGIHEHERPSHP